GQLTGDTRSAGCVSKSDRTAASGDLQPDAGPRVDPGRGARAEADARRDPEVPSPGGASAGTILGGDEARFGGIACSQLQPGAAREPPKRTAGRAVCDDSDRYRRLSAALLDGAAGAVSDLRERQGGCAGAGAGLRRGSDFSRLGHDSAAWFLSACHGGPRGRTGEAEARSAAADGPGFI